MRRLVPILACALLAIGVAVPPAGADAVRGATFSGTGVWIDVWDALELQPETVVRSARRRHVSAIYVETSNARSPVAVVNPEPLRRLVALAHAAGIRVIPWYLPGYQRRALDRRRLLAALAIGGDEAVDGIGVDIEATYVRDDALRARRAGALLAWLRAGRPDLPVAAITPNPVHNYWPIFPWGDIRRSADAVLPMCYAPRRLTPAQMAAMTRGCVRRPRVDVGDPAFPVHVISGLAGGLSRANLRAAARASLAAGADGFSLYDLATTTPAGWGAVRLFAAG